MKDQFLAESKLLIEKEKFKHALDILFSIWKQDKSPDVAALILLCFIKERKWKSVDEWYLKFKEKFKNDSQIEDIYTNFIKEKNVQDLYKAKDVNDLIKKFNELETFLSHKEKNQFYLKISFKHKMNNDWDDAIKWLGKIDITDENDIFLSKDDLRHFFLHKADILNHLNQEDSLSALYEKAMLVFPEINQFYKDYLQFLKSKKRFDELEAVCRAKLHDKKNKLLNFEFLIYALINKKQLDSAWQIAGQAFLLHLDDRFKCDFFEILHDLAIQLDKIDLAKMIWAYEVFVRIENKMELRPELVENLKSFSNPNISGSQLYEKIEEEMVQAAFEDIKKERGEIVFFPQDKNFAIVKIENNGKVIINKHDLGIDSHYEGAKIIVFTRFVKTDEESKKNKKIALMAKKLYKLETT